MFQINLHTTDDAIASAARQEVARLLREVATRLETGEEAQGWVHDANGNHVGNWWLRLPPADAVRPFLLRHRTGCTHLGTRLTFQGAPVNGYRCECGAPVRFIAGKPVEVQP